MIPQELSLEVSRASRNKEEWPQWLRKELKTDHAGEVAAVCIYDGAYYGLKTRNCLKKYIRWIQSTNDALEFVVRHKKAEQIHLDTLNLLLTDSEKSKLFIFWKFVSYLLGFISSFIGGPYGLYWTVYAIENFVKQHYDSQIVNLEIEHKKRQEKSFESLSLIFEQFKEEETRHEEEAIKKLTGKTHSMEFSDAPFYIKVWFFLVYYGSMVAVMISRYI